MFKIALCEVAQFQLGQTEPCSAATGATQQLHHIYSPGLHHLLWQAYMHIACNAAIARALLSVAAGTEDLASKLLPHTVRPPSAAWLNQQQQEP